MLKRALKEGGGGGGMEEEEEEEPFLSLRTEIGLSGGGLFRNHSPRLHPCLTPPRYD